MADTETCDRCSKTTNAIVGLNGRVLCLTCFPIEMKGVGELTRVLRDLAKSQNIKEEHDAQAD